jgi:hypothetical protein
MPAPPVLACRRPPAYVEWRQLRDWGKPAERENDVVGCLLLTAREEARLTQDELAARLGA